MIARTLTRLRRGLVALIWLVGFAAFLQLTTTVLRIVFWRTQWQPGLDLVRRFNRIIENPRALKTAGRPGKTMAAVHHTGRASGREYVTPVWAERVGDAFFIQLPYGTNVDWCRNIMANGRSTLEHDGVRYDVVDPTVVPAADAVPILPTGMRWMQRLAGVRSYLRLDIASKTPLTTAAS